MEPAPLGGGGAKGASGCLAGCALLPCGRRLVGGEAGLRVIMTVLMLAAAWAAGAELKVSDVTSAQGDGPDGKGNTADDRWQFWFELAHAPGSFRPLTRHSSAIPAGGIAGKVRGPVAGLLPNPKETEGWVLHTDWDARFEGIWGDKKRKEVLVHPYVEKTAHQAVAITYKIPENGTYRITGGLTDVQVRPEHEKHDGTTWRIEIVNPEKNQVYEMAKSKPFGDGNGRPDSSKFESPLVRLRKGYLVRLVIHPNGWWGQDLTRVDYFRVEKR